MDHIVYLDAKAKEMENLLANNKSMIIRGAAGRKMPYGRVFKDDVLYFLNNNGEGKVKAKGLVKNVFNSEKMTPEESAALINKYQNKLLLTNQQLKKWQGKRYIILIEVNDVKEIKPFEIVKTDFKNMDDWLPVEEIKKVILK